MKPFAQFIVTACIALLSWWQLELYIGLSAVTVAILAAGAGAAFLTWRSSRIGFGLGALVGAAYLAEIIWLSPPSTLEYMLPLLGWSAGLIGAAGWLLWVTREKAAKRPAYERHSQY